MRRRLARAACHPTCHQLSETQCVQRAWVRTRSPVTRAPWRRQAVTGTKRWATTTVDATGKRDAQRQASAWEVELRDQDRPHPRGTFGGLAEQWMAVKERRWPPNTLQEHRRIVARNLARSTMSTSPRSPPTPSTSSTPSSLPAAAPASTGPARPHPARSPALDVGARSANARHARKAAPARTGRRVTISRAGNGSSAAGPPRAVAACRSSFSASMRMFAATLLGRRSRR